LKGLFDLFSQIYFPEVKVTLNSSEEVEIKTYFPKDVLKKISKIKLRRNRAL